MAPELTCPRCGYTRRLGERGLSMRVATCPDCPEAPPLTFNRAADLPFEEIGETPRPWRAKPRSGPGR